MKEKGILKYLTYRIKELEDENKALDEELSDLLWLKLNPVLEYISNIGDNASQFKKIAEETVRFFYKYN